MKHIIKKNSRKTKGFTLLELLIVVAIIMILAALAIPRFLQARNTASQASTAGSLKNLSTGLTMFYTNYNTYPATIAALGGAAPCTPSVTTGCVLDDTIAGLINTGTYNNYTWTYTPVASPVGFTITAVPAAGNGAVRSFFLNEGGTTHYSDSGAATATSPVLGN